ncbi:hypothetical protein NDU88_001426 [Pleurodeles waltl]|uniref:Retropepsins domain-containing protein n=1 Tax=Pleurodeles waltl TaxID=8319 RepID=A0AAV7VZW3_PLEWA|nr:hypothetical protein NDU88_001426 [Pleurodeles waltl]
MCGRAYPHQGKCPAMGKQCTNCQRINHFAKVCRSAKKPKSGGRKVIHEAQTIQQQNEVLDMDDDDEPEGTVYIIHTTQPGNGRGKRIPRCTVKIDNHQVPALIDTGASINILAQSVFRQLPTRPQLRPTTMQEECYVATDGFIWLGVIYTSRWYAVA